MRISHSAGFFSLVLTLAALVLWRLTASGLNYYIASVGVIILSMLPFFISFEVKTISSKEITLTATLITLAVVSRTVFYLIPQVKPIAAVVIVSAVCMGAERGYIIGAFSAFVSNFIFGQGFWTPFQMAALGAVGLTAGIIFKYIKINRWTLAVVGFFLSSVLYGSIVDISTVLVTYGNKITLSKIVSIYASGAPFSAAFGISTACFLFIFGESFIKKINRINIKYDIFSTK